MDSDSEMKIEALAMKIAKIGESAGKSEAKQLAKSETAKRFSKIVESCAKKHESGKNTIDDPKVKKICNKIAMSNELSFADLTSAVNTILLRLAKMEQPQKVKKAKEVEA